MEAVLIIGIATVAAIGVYLVAVGAFLVPNVQSPVWRRRRRGLGTLYLISGIAPVGLGLLAVVGTAFGETDASDEAVDSSFAGGIVDTLDDSVWYLTGGWLIVGGSVMRSVRLAGVGGGRSQERC